MSVVTGFAQAFGGPAYQSLIPSLVEKKHLPNAIALNSIQFNLSRILGSLFAGATIATLGTALCFGLNGLSYFVVIVALLVVVGEAHLRWRAEADARRDTRGIQSYAARPRAGCAHCGGVPDDVSRAPVDDVSADFRARGVQRRHRLVQPDDGVRGRGLGDRSADRGVAWTLPTDGVDAADRPGRLRPGGHRVLAVAERSG